MAVTVCVPPTKLYRSAIDQPAQDESATWVGGCSASRAALETPDAVTEIPLRGVFRPAYGASTWTEPPVGGLSIGRGERIQSRSALQGVPVSAIPGQRRLVTLALIAVNRDSHETATIVWEVTQPAGPRISVATI